MSTIRLPLAILLAAQTFSLGYADMIHLSVLSSSSTPRLRPLRQPELRIPPGKVRMITFQMRGVPSYAPLSQGQWHHHFFQSKIELIVLSSNNRTSREQADTGSEWTSETTRNLLERIKQMRENAQYLPEVPSSTNLSPLSPVTSSSSNTRSPPPPTSPPTSWSSRHLSPNIRRDSLTSLFSGTGSTSLRSKIPKLNLKKRFKKQVDSETNPVSDSALATRARHIPLVGLGISGVDPFCESQCDETVGLSREDSDATLMPPKSRLSYSSQCSEDASEIEQTCQNASSSTYSIVSPKISVDDADFRHTPTLSRAYSADLLARPERRTPAELLRAHSEDLLSLSKRNHAEPLECASLARTASSSFTLKRLRSSNPLSVENRSISDGGHQRPAMRTQRSRFNSAFSFPDVKSHSSSLSYAQLMGRLRRVRGVSKLSKQFGGSRLDVLAAESSPPDAGQKDYQVKDENRQSYDEQVCTSVISTHGSRSC